MGLVIVRLNPRHVSDVAKVEEKRTKERVPKLNE
jgi:hypothetical protein